MAETSMTRTRPLSGHPIAGPLPAQHDSGAGTQPASSQAVRAAGRQTLRWRRQRRLAALLILLAAWFCVSCVAVAEFTPVGMAELFPSERQSKTTLVINKVLERFHYRNFQLDDKFAHDTLLNYFEDLDPNRSFFLERDIERFTRGADRLDDDLDQGRLDVAFDIFRVYRMRVDSRIEYALSQLDQPFDFDRAETYRFDRDDADWAKSDAELDAIWRQRVKYDFLTLKLAGDPDDKIREQLRKRYEGISRRIHQFTADDVYEAFVNAYTRTLEPHTSYMSPSTSENFDISMRLKLEGIGAVLSAENEYTVIQRTIAGGPARQSGQISSGDRIVGVAQGHGGEMEDVIGWRLQDVVDKIRGPKGSVVRLEILPKAVGSGGRTREIELVRNEIKLEDQAAHSYVIEGPKNAPSLRIGVIEVPAFYRDFRAESEGTSDFTSTTRDVRRLIQELEAKGINGLVIDLRGNGGGSLTEATSLTGLFIEEGPVVQVKDALGKVDVESDTDPGVAYSGPLAVLVDRNSASASEIFAGAIQDYNRGLILGEPTYGKGTVQTLVDLGRFLRSREDIGRLRLTMAQFFRVEGGSTQHRGVMPDIVFPTAKGAAEHGERALDNALPWASIKPASHTRLAVNAAAGLRDASAQRIASNPGFQFLVAEEDDLMQLEKKKVVSLRESVRRAEWQQQEKQRLDRRNRLREFRGLPPLANLDDDEDKVAADADGKDDEGIQRIMLEESANILADQIRAQRPRTAQLN